MAWERKKPDDLEISALFSFPHSYSYCEQKIRVPNRTQLSPIHSFSIRCIHSRLPILYPPGRPPRQFHLDTFNRACTASRLVPTSIVFLDPSPRSRSNYWMECGIHFWEWDRGVIVFLAAFLSLPNNVSLVFGLK